MSATLSNKHRTGELNTESEMTLASVTQSVQVKSDHAMNAQTIASNKNEATVKYKEIRVEEHRPLRVRPDSVGKELRQRRRNKQRSTFTVKTSSDASRRVQSASVSHAHSVCVSQRPKTSVGTSRTTSKSNEANNTGKLPDIKQDTLKADLSSIEGSSHSGLSDLDGSEGSVRTITG